MSSLGHDMSRQLLFVITAGLGLSGCCLESRSYFEPSPNTLASWDHLAPKHRLKPVKVPKASEATAANESSADEQELSKLKPYSKEWAAALNAMNRADDERLRRKLIICRGCVPPESTDQTGSIGAGGYIPARQ